MERRVTVNDLIALHYENLSPQLRLAADYIADHHHDVASRSLRAVAASSNLNPPTFSRLARALGLQSHEDMRELCRKEIKYRSLSFAEKATALRMEEKDGDDADQTPFALRQTASAVRNINQFANELDVKRLRLVADRLVKSKRVLIAGSMASAGFAEYFSYLANLAFTNWHVVGLDGTSLATSMTGLENHDAVVIIMKHPYARRSVDAAQIAFEAGAFVIIVSDSISCPAFRYASHYFIVPTDSPQFFSSYIATLLLLETLIGMVIRRSGLEASNRIEEVEMNNHRLHEYWQVNQPTSIREL
ncbi:MurR/RpiR family transcriptional regulator [Hoeflea prorocentri]|uniref:MurR/RpiR family transcriptional regulator n=1 Tax=Hoeflea prorocentri TaxID=1922333 RepID=A0A9X3UJR3_9HYPH|nr:MurR/RpiR family transcriptional regulator [Hoeflea prorocentri]MCY6382622.1 MurR/RpiR family transcriptional regulator [Hoeflea prorocentri]MDA5400422.1 MurR/RpiR family transcriptional regulator [Hoeflea prorocentri]